MPKFKNEEVVNIHQEHTKKPNHSIKVKSGEDYESFIKSLGGKVITIKSEEHTTINPFEIDDVNLSGAGKPGQVLRNIIKENGL